MEEFDFDGADADAGGSGTATSARRDFDYDDDDPGGGGTPRRGGGRDSLGSAASGSSSRFSAASSLGGRSSSSSPYKLAGRTKARRRKGSTAPSPSPSPRRLAAKDDESDGGGGERSGAGSPSSVRSASSRPGSAVGRTKARTKARRRAKTSSADDTDDRPHLNLGGKKGRALFDPGRTFAAGAHTDSRKENAAPPPSKGSAQCSLDGRAGAGAPGTKKPGSKLKMRRKTAPKTATNGDNGDSAGLAPKTKTTIDGGADVDTDDMASRIKEGGRRRKRAGPQPPGRPPMPSPWQRRAGEGEDLADDAPPSAAASSKPSATTASKKNTATSKSRAVPPSSSQEFDGSIAFSSSSGTSSSKSKSSAATANGTVDTDDMASRVKDGGRRRKKKLAGVPQPPRLKSGAAAAGSSSTTSAAASLSVASSSAATPSSSFSVPTHQLRKGASKQADDSGPSPSSHDSLGFFSAASTESAMMAPPAGGRKNKRKKTAVTSDAAPNHPASPPRASVRKKNAAASDEPPPTPPSPHRDDLSLAAAAADAARGSSLASVHSEVSDCKPYRTSPENNKDGDYDDDDDDSRFSASSFREEEEQGRPGTAQSQESTGLRSILSTPGHPRPEPDCGDSANRSVRFSLPSSLAPSPSKAAGPAGGKPGATAREKGGRGENGNTAPPMGDASNTREGKGKDEANKDMDDDSNDRHEFGRESLQSVSSMGSGSAAGGGRRKRRVRNAPAVGPSASRTVGAAAAATSSSKRGRQDDEGGGDDYLSFGSSSSRGGADYEYDDGTGSMRSVRSSKSTGSKRRVRRRGGYGSASASSQDGQHRQQMSQDSHGSYGGDDASFASTCTGDFDDDGFELTVGVGGAGTDAYAVQDAGSYRMLYDECSYLCGTVLSSLSEDTKKDGIGGKGGDLGSDCEEETKPDARSGSKKAPEGPALHTSITADAACDLALMVSSRRSRSVLLSAGDNNGAAASRKKKNGGGGALPILLDALGCVPEVPAPSDDFALLLWGNAGTTPEEEESDEEEKGDDDDEDSTWNAILEEGQRDAAAAAAASALSPFEKESEAQPANGGRGRTKAGRRRRGGAGDHAASAASSNSQTAETKAVAAVPAASAPSSTSSKYDPVASHSLAVLAHFVSLDCCVKADQSVAATPKMARKVRRRVLRHSEAMRGIARMALMDPLVGKILAEAGEEAAAKIDNGDAEGNEAANEDGGIMSQLSQESEVELGHSQDQGSPDSQMSLDSASSLASGSRGQEGQSESPMTPNDERRTEDQQDSLDFETTPGDDHKPASSSAVPAARDPTKSGRRSRKGKKKRRRINTQQHVPEPGTGLDPIPEDEDAAMQLEDRSAAGSSCPRDRANEAGEDTEESSPESLAKNSLPQSQRLGGKAETKEELGDTPHSLGFYSDGTPMRTTPQMEHFNPSGANGNAKDPEGRKRKRADKTSSSSKRGQNRFERKIQKASKRIAFKTTGADGGGSKPFDAVHSLDAHPSFECPHCKTCSQVGSSGGGDDDVVAALNNPGHLALQAINRIITGKEIKTSDDKDDDEEEEEAEEEEESGSESDEQDSDDGQDQEALSQETAGSSVATEEGVDFADGEYESGGLKNPLVFTNVMLRRSGSLPLLARAMAETAAAIVRVLEAAMLRDEYGSVPDGKPGVSRGGVKGTKRLRNCCPACLSLLQRRFSDLAAIVDWACCLSTENRRILCSDSPPGAAVKNGHIAPGYKLSSDDDAGILISGLLRLATIVPLELELSSPVLSEIVLCTMRTLTSLTHENTIAGAQLLRRYDAECVSRVGRDLLGIKQRRRPSGVAIILHLLHGMTIAQRWRRRLEGAAALKRAAEARGSDRDAILHHCYDVVTFCLNILANILHGSAETSRRARKVVRELSLTESDDVLGVITKRALSWLTGWLVSQTESYRDAVMKGSFGKEGEVEIGKDTADAPRDLEKHEEEYLLTAGNGFIVLACIMREPTIGVAAGGSNADYILAEKRLTSDIRGIVLSKMPHDSSCGPLLMVKTLKAFCNFYHYSLGALSVPIVTPVFRLIQDLEKM